IKRRGDAGTDSGKDKDPEFERFDGIPDKTDAAFRITDRAQHPAGAGFNDHAAGNKTECEGDRGNDEKHDTGFIGMKIKAENILEIGESVVAPETHVIAEKGKH